MTAAKIMDIISSLPSFDGQAADAVSAYTQVKMEDAHKLLKIPKSECPDIWIRLPRHKWFESWSSMEDPVVPLERNLYGHSLAGLFWVRQFEKVLLKHGWEKIPNWECLFVHREKGLFLSVYVDDIKLAGKKQNLDPMWKVLNKEVDWGEPTSFLNHVYLGCTHRQREIIKDIVDNFCGWIRENTIPPKSSHSFTALWHCWSCKEVCGTILWVGEQDDTATLQSIYSMHRWPPLQRGRNKICWRIVKYLLSNCSEMLIFGKNWTTWYLMVCEEARTCHNKMDQSLWQTSESIDFIYSSHESIQTILSCGKYCLAMQIGTVSGLWLCGRSWRFKIHFWRNIVHFGKSYVCSNRLDVQETNISFSQFNRIWNYLSGHGTEIGWFACSGIRGNGNFSNFLRRLSQALVHFVMARASLFTDHKISGRPILAKYKHFRTIWEHVFDNSPTDFVSSSLKWWSSVRGVDTL